MFDIITVGHLAIDLIKSARITSPKPTLGGSPAYVSLAAAKLGAKVSVVSKVGRDFPKDYVKLLRENNIDLSGLKLVQDALTTKFLLKYQNNWKRTLQLKNRAPPISASDFSLLPTKAIHVAPIANEIFKDVILKLRRSTNILSLDPQGFVRGFDTKGKVYLKRWLGEAVLELIDIYKSSQDEVKMVTETNDIKLAAEKIRDLGVKIVIITQGVHGSTLFFEKSSYSVPAYQPNLVLDPTGAGDAFIGAFLAEYLRDGDPLWCACVGAACASFVVEGIGSERFGERQETYERANEIYEKQLRN